MKRLAPERLTAVLVLSLMMLLTFGASRASADITPSPFTITPSAIGNVNYGPTNNVGFKSFNYELTFTIGAGDPSGTIGFTETGFTNIQGLSAYNPVNPTDTTQNLASSITGLGGASGYSLYEKFALIGSATSTGSGTANITYTGGTLSLYGNNAPGVNLTLGGGLPAGSVLIGTAIITTGQETVCMSCTLNQGAYDIQGVFTRSGPGAGFLSGPAFAGGSTIMDFNGVLSFIDTACPGCKGDGTGFFQITGSGNQSFTSLEIVPPSVAPVPEPASLLLMGSGLFGLGFWQFRRQA